MKKSVAVLTFTLMLGLWYFAPPAEAQRLVATVSTNTEKLILEARQKLINIKEEVENYVNDYQWCDDSRRYSIPVQIDIFFERAQATSFEDRYEALLILSNGTDYQASDKRWGFRYQQGTPLSHSGQFEPLTAMLDFYIYIMLGQEFDKIAKLGGDPFYQKAFNVVQQSKSSEFFADGWRERSLHINNIMSEIRYPLRELEYYFLQSKQWYRMDNRKTANQYLRVILIRLKAIDPELTGLDRFYQLHHLDIARMLSVLGMRKELDELIILNPANKVTYEQFISQISE
jgi:hypothetical protein